MSYFSSNYSLLERVKHIRMCLLKIQFHVSSVFLQFRQDGTDLETVVKWGETYPLAYPMWIGPFVSLLNIHHPDYVRTILASTGAFFFPLLTLILYIGVIWKPG